MSENIPISLHPGGDTGKGRGRGVWEGQAGGCCSKLTLFNFHKILWQRARATDLRQQRRFDGVSLCTSLSPPYLPPSLLLSLCFPLWLNGNALVMLWSIDGSLWRCVASCRVTEAEVPVSIIYLVVYSNNNNTATTTTRMAYKKLVAFCYATQIFVRCPGVPPLRLPLSLQLFE